jgi:hypothetical protein
MDESIKRPAIIALVLAFVAAAGVLVAWNLTPGVVPEIPAKLTEVNDNAELMKFVEMSHLGILTSTNYLGHRIYTVRATLKNISPSPIRLVYVKMTFRDAQKRGIHEETHPAFEPRQPPLEPGTEYRFEIPFENPPKTWNYHVPDTEVIRVGY